MSVNVSEIVSRVAVFGSNFSENGSDLAAFVISRSPEISGWLKHAEEYNKYSTLIDYDSYDWFMISS